MAEMMGLIERRDIVYKAIKTIRHINLINLELSIKNNSVDEYMETLTMDDKLDIVADIRVNNLFDNKSIDHHQQELINIWI